MTSHREVVKAPASVVWRLLLDKIRRPDKYVPGVEKVEVVAELGPDSIERKMWTGDGKMIHEIIGADATTRTVIFRSHATHPVFSGFVTNTVLPAEGSAEPVGADVEPAECILDYSLNWSPKAGAPEQAVSAAREAMPKSIRGAVIGTKKLAEDAVGQASE